MEKFACNLTFPHILHIFSAMKLYEYVPDSASEKQGFLRIIDEEGEPYYYDARAFRKIDARRNGLLIPFEHSAKPRRKRTRTKAYSH